MKAQLQRVMEFLRTGFWFVPMMMLLAAAGLALGLLYLDEKVDPGLKTSLAWAYSGGAEGARSLLSTVAGSMITAASVTFSLASVALSIASQQYGSRVLRNFMRDRITQVLLGTFVATFIYSVLVVRAIRGSDVSGGFVPAMSVTVAIVMSVASMLLLIYFIHHVSESIQASKIVQVIADDMSAAIPKLYPSETGEGREARLDESFREGACVTIVAERGGYLQTIDLDTLLKVATEQDVVVEVRIKPGDARVDGGEVATVWGRTELADDVAAKLQKAFYFGGTRTPAQDIRFQFQQLTDVVVRALSAGINDPFTAINGIDELANGLVRFGRRPRVRAAREDNEGRLRLLVARAGFSDVLNETVGHIAVYAAEDGFVMAALRRALASAEPFASLSVERETIERLRGVLDAREAAKEKESCMAE